MKLKRFIYVMFALLLPVASTPSFAVSKEIIQLQTQVQQLQDQMALMQQSFDERMGVMRHLVEQQTDTINQVNAGIQNLQKTLAQQQVDTGQGDDQISGQVQMLSDSLDEVSAKLAKFSAQLSQLANEGQNIAQPAVTSQLQVPPPDVLYNNALDDYYAGRLDLASQEFSNYVKYYPIAERAGNAQFYLAEIEYTQGNFAAAVKDYETVLEQYPGGSKMESAQLKKGLV